MKTLPANNLPRPFIGNRLFSCVLLLAALCISPRAQAQSYQLTPLWTVPVGAASHPFMIADNNTRGLAYNPATGHVLVPSRTGAPAIHILSETTGETLGTLPFDATLVTGGNFAVNMIGVTDDGVIYVGNLTTDTTGANGPFRLYRWANETAQPQLAYAGDPSNADAVANNRRFGDSLALRGTGNNTQILLGTLDKNVALLTTTDGVNFTATKIVTDGAAADSRWGLAWGAGNTFWAKQASGNLKRFSLDAGVGTATQTLSVAGVVGAPMAVDLSRNLLAIVEAGSTVAAGHKLRIYDIFEPAAPVQQDVTRDFPIPTANGNLTGAADLRNGKLFALESNNGILAFSLSEVYLAPTITSPPANVNLWVGAENYTFRVGVSGSRTLYYQWRLNGEDIPGATGPALTIPTVTAESQGQVYSVVVSNEAGSATSAGGTISVSLGNPSAVVENIWNAAPGTRPYLTSGYREYGVAINPLTENVIVVTRPNPTNMLAVLDLKTGAHKHYIDYSGLGVIGMNKVDVADDGTVYVCNLTTSSANPFHIYGFGEDTPTTTDKWIAFTGDPGNGQTAASTGWGNTFAVRGSGLNTEILIGALSSNERVVAILRPNASYIFSSTVITVADAPAGFARLGLDWGPGGNTFWAKTAGGNLILVEFDLVSGTGFVRKSYPQTGARSVPSSFTGLRYDSASGLLAGLRNGSPPTPVSVPVYDVSDLDAGPFWADHELFTSYNADIEFQGTVDFGAGHLVALGVNNGLKAFKVNAGVASLPAIVTHPSSTTWYSGTSPTLSVVADSVTALSYQWFFGENEIAGATASTLVITNIQLAQAGAYKVRVTNAGGSRDSLPANITVLDTYGTAQATNVWTLTAGSRSYLNTGYNEYGMSFNPANSNLLVVSVVSGVPTVAVLDALTGDDKHVLDVSPITASGAKVLHKIDVADDGAVYAANLTTTAASSPFKIYRWENDSPTTVPTVAFEGDPAPTLWPNRGCGYTLDVRGAGVNTEILLGMGAWNATSNIVAVLKTTDGVNFTATEIHVPDAPSGFSRLGLCFGQGNTFWAKTWLDQLYLVEYDLATGLGTIVKTYPASQFPTTITSIAYSGALGFLAGTANEAQKNVLIYSVADVDAGPQLRDQELFPTYNVSIEANGELDFGGNYLFVLNENNGIMAFWIDTSYVPPVTSFKILSATVSEGSITLEWEAQLGAGYQVQYANSINGEWFNLGDPVNATGSTATYTDVSPSAAQRFYRIVGQ